MQSCAWRDGTAGKLAVRYHSGRCYAVSLRSTFEWSKTPKFRLRWLTHDVLTSTPSRDPYYPSHRASSCTVTHTRPPPIHGETALAWHASQYVFMA